MTGEPNDTDDFMRDFRRRTASRRAYEPEDENPLDDDEFPPEFDDSSFVDVSATPFVPLVEQEVIRLGNLTETPTIPEGYRAKDIEAIYKAGEYTLSKRMLVSTKYREYQKLFYQSIGLSEKRGRPLNLHADDLIRIEQMNRKIRGNRLAGSGVMNTIRIDVFAYVWRNSVIIARNEMHVFMLSIYETATGMGIDESSVIRAFKAMESVGLIKRIGKSMRGLRSFTNCYQIADLDEFFKEQNLKIPRNYALRARVSDIIVGKDKTQLGRRNPKKEKEEEKEKSLVLKKEKQAIKSPLWDLFKEVMDERS